MKISIIGSNGFLANAIGKYANKQGWHLDIYGLTVPEKLQYDRFIEINLMNKDPDCVSMVDSDIIINAMGAGIQSNLKESADLIYALNVTVPVKICNNLKRLSYKGVFVTFGSYSELGESSINRPAAEEDIMNAAAPAPTDYVVSKRMLTRFAASYKHDFTHWHFILPTIYGPGENPKRLIPYTIHAIKHGEEVHFTSGEQVRQYIFVGDVAKIIDIAMSRSLASGIYNIAGDGEHTVREIVAMIYNNFGVSMPEGCFGSAYRTDVGMKYLVLDNCKLRRGLGEMRFYSIDEVLMSY